MPRRRWRPLLVMPRLAPQVRAHGKRGLRSEETLGAGLRIGPAKSPNTVFQIDLSYNDLRGMRPLLTGRPWGNDRPTWARDKRATNFAPATDPEVPGYCAPRITVAERRERCLASSTAKRD